MLQMAATRAGYHTTIGITESTAAAMAYGLSFVVAASSSTTTTTTLSSSLSSQPTTTTHPSTTTASIVTTKTTTTTSDIPNQRSTTNVHHKATTTSTLPSSASTAQQDQGTKWKQTIFVFDMGGGTTDVTIAERSLLSTNTFSSNDDATESKNDDNDIDFHVCVTVGNDQLGGDDMDQVIMNLVHSKIQDEQRVTPSNTVSAAMLPQKPPPQLLRQCRLAKLALCGDIDHDVRPVDTYIVSIPDDTKIKSITITQKEFELALVPIIQSTRDLIQSALDEYEIKREASPPPLNRNGTINSSPEHASGRPKTAACDMNEVILIGGASRVPYIRQLLRDIFISSQPDPSVKELCTSINAMSAVAQGCSVSAIIYSGRVPIHEIKSAYMLDTMPYSIGVLTTVSTSPPIDSDDPVQSSEENVDNGLQSSHFIEILSRGESLPAAGYSTFVLNDLLQKGITVVAVEQIPMSPSSLSPLQNSERDTSKGQRYHYNVIGEFTFLLHRLSKEQIQRLKDLENSIRTIDVGMTLKESGEFVVSIFDKNDPDHIRKKLWYQRNQEKNNEASRTNTKKSNNSQSFATTTIRSEDTDAEPFTYEQIILMVSCLVVFLLYIATKLTFPETIITTQSES